MKLNLPERRKVRIEIVPLIDIIFLLLLFFIYAMLTMRVHHSTPVQLPVSAAAEVDKRKPVSVSIQADGSIYLDELPVSLDELSAALREEEALVSGAAAVMLFADRRVDYQCLYKVLDQIRLAGIQRIALQAEPTP